MDVSDVGPKAPRNPVGQILTHEGRSVALVDLGSSASDALRAAWRETGKHPHESGGIVESAWFLPALGGASMASSSLLAGNVFLATANPATLMTIGVGVGSAVMGPAGIVAHAPFVAASNALMPVVAPLMLFTTVSAVVTGARLDRVQRNLGRLSDEVERVRRVLEARDYARFESAASVLDGLGSEFAKRQRFGTGDATTLAMARQSTKELRAQFGQLVEAPVTSEKEARDAVADLNRFFLATILDLRAETFRVYLALREDPDLVEHRQARLGREIERCAARFHDVLDADRVGDFHRRFREEHAKKSPRRKWIEKLPPVVRRRLDGKADPALERIEAIRQDDHAVRARIAELITAFEGVADEAREPSLIVCREPDGERALRAVRTRAVRLEKAA
ncbi:MAG: hypothetical protein OXC11_13275 [Rhodospirillales bacterium]|nr:hypothetical protein [Rhodospirillales bacterium]